MPSPLIFGELLYDQFESGETVLGGAPMNVAWHLHGLGQHPTLVSRVGNDELGTKARQTLQARGLDGHDIQLDNEHPTGTVQVRLAQGTPDFNIVDDVAYDHITLPAESTLARQYDLLYHGSLALRSATSRHTLQQLQQHLGCPVFVDVNLRAPFWDMSLIRQIVADADWVKLNHEELALLTDTAVTQQRDVLIPLARELRHENTLRALIVTCGAAGAFIVTEQELFDMTPVTPAQMIDTVGAGDGFSALVIAGLLQGWNFQRILQRANQFAARICAIRGAIPDNESFYADFLE